MLPRKLVCSAIGSVDIVGSGQGVCVFANVDLPMLSLFPPPGPSISPFSSLLVKGSYHSSALIHLAIGHVLQSPKHEVLIFSPSQSSFKQKLISGFDEWLSRSVNTNKMKAAVSRIMIVLDSLETCLLLSRIVSKGSH